MTLRINGKLVGDHKLTFRTEIGSVLGKCTCGWWYRRSSKLKQPDAIIRHAWRKAHREIAR